MQSDLFNIIQTEISQLVSEPNVFRSLIILAIAFVAAYFLSHFIGKFIIRVTQAVAVRSDQASDPTTGIRLRRVETYLTVTVALVRALIVGFVAFATWRVLSPSSNSAAAAIGASAFFFVIAGATIGMLLRDITAGAIMIIERWFNVGDFIKVDPFWDLGGVVERMTLRSTKLRSLTGEVIWLHNQHIQGVRVTPHGIRIIKVDVFVKDEQKGQKLIQNIIDTVPVGPVMMARKLEVIEKEKWGDQIWRLTVIGSTAPGREWLVEDFFVNSLVEADKKARLLVRKPLVHYADPDAERNFRRAVRVTRTDTTHSADE